MYPPNGYANAVKQGKHIHQTVTSSSNNTNTTNHPTHPQVFFLGLGSSNHKTLKTPQTGQKVIQNKGLGHSVNNIPIVYHQGKGIGPNVLLRQKVGQNVNQINHLHGFRSSMQLAQVTNFFLTSSVDPAVDSFAEACLVILMVL